MLAAVALCATACGRSDADLRSIVAAQIAADAVTKTAHITVDVQDHVVHLSGTVEDRAQPARAVLIAEAVKGVRRVTTDLPLSNTGVAAAVKSALAADPNLARIPITVTASSGEVTLDSNATGPDDRARAVAIAKTIEGVRIVVDNMK
jgi:hyperosmotically inducible protein